MQKKRLKIIPDIAFHKLWAKADEYESADGYINATINNPKIFNYKNYGLDYPEYATMLKNVYKFRHYKLKDISKSTSKRKSELSHIFCIPIRTIEAWYSEINVIPSYILLMMLKQFHLLDLGKYVRLSSEVEYVLSKPSIYKKHDKKDMGEQEVTDEQKQGYPKTKEKTEFEKFMESEDYDTYLDKLIESVKNNRNSNRSKTGQNILND